MRHPWLHRSTTPSDVVAADRPTIARKVSRQLEGQVFQEPGGLWKPTPLGGPSHQCVVHDEDDDRPYDGDQYAPQINTGDTGRT